MAEITKTFSSDPQLMPDIEEWMLGELKKLDIPQEKLSSIGIAVSEAAANSIVHGNLSDSRKEVRISINLNDNELVITLFDEGKGFNINDIQDPTLPENMLKESGRGIYIMKSIVDNLEFQFSDKGTTTILKIKL